MGVPLGEQQPIRRKSGEAKGQRLARRARQLLERCLAQDLRVVAVGDDEPAILGEDLGGNARMRGEIEPVAVQPIVRPFAVDAKVLDRGLDLDDRELALVAEAEKNRNLAD